MKKLVIFLTPFLFLLAAVPVLAQSSSLKASKISTLPKDETHEGNYYAAGQTVEILGNVTGDVYAAGNQIIVEGNIQGDLIVAGGTITISGNVGQDLRAAGGNITINGQVGQNVSVVGGDIQLTSNSSIGKALQAAGGNIIIAAAVGEEIKLGAGSVTISNTVGKNIDAKVGTMRLTSSAIVNGDINYWSEEEASIDETASVSGTISKHKTEESYKMPSKEEVATFFQGVHLFLSFTSFLTTLVIGLLYVRLFPEHLKRGSQIVKGKPWASIGVGFLALIILPALMLVLITTVIGIPLALMLTSVFFVYLFIARLYVFYALGQIILDRTGATGRVGWSMITGLLVYSVICMIPFIGGLARIILLLTSLGVALQTDKAGYLLAKEKKII